MSVQKKLSTLSNNVSIVNTFTNSQMSMLRKKLAIRSKELYQVSSDREITVNNASYGVQGDFRIRETFTGCVVLELRLPAGTYQLPNNWATLSIKRMRERIGGENETTKDGWANAIQSFREADNDIVKRKYDGLTGGAVTNPTSEVVGYVLLNIQTSSINPHIKQLYPNYQLNTSAEFELDFEEWGNVAIAGAQQNFVSAKILFEYASPLNNKDLNAKFPNPSNPAMKWGEDIVFHDIVSYDYAVPASGSVEKEVRLRSFPLSEYDELVYMFVNDTDLTTNKNNLLSQPLTDHKFIMSNQEIIDAKRNFQDIKALFRNEQPNIHYVGGVEKPHYVLDLTAVTYIEQEKKLMYQAGVVLSEETNLLRFKVPADVAGRLFIYGVRKRLTRFRNGNAQHFY